MTRHSRFTLGLALATLLLPLKLFAASFTLYDTTPNDTPGAQPWLLFGTDDLFGTTVTETPLGVGAGVNLVSNNGFSAGYSNTIPILNVPKNAGFPDLDRGLGFSLEIELELISESHLTNDRAGFSVILLGNDLLGIEVGFWDDRVWAQNAGFTHGEETLLGGMQAPTTPHDYELRILGNDYDLLQGGVSILTGLLRNYSAFGTPYDIPNFLFLGDDTGSAQAEINLGRVQLNTVESNAPLPPSWALMLPALLILRQRAL